MSIKDNARRALLLATTAVITTAFFTGCDKDQPSPVELDLDKISSRDDSVISDGDNASTSQEDESNDTAISNGNESEESQGDEGADNVVSAISKEDISNGEENEDDDSTALIPDGEGDEDTTVSNRDDSTATISRGDNSQDTDTSLADTTISKGDSSQGTISKGDNSQENDTTTAAPVAPQPKWTETPTSGTMYVNTDWTNARKEAIIGATSVRLYNINDAVNVVAKTNTDYYKLDDGSFIHSDYLSSTKVEIPTYTPPEPEPAPAPTVTIPSSSGNTGNNGGGSAGNNGGSTGNTGGGNNGGGSTGNTGGGTPYNGQTKVENGKTYTYVLGFGWIEGAGGGSVVTGDYSGDILSGNKVGTMG